MRTFADINLDPSTSDLRELRWTLLVGGAIATAGLALLAHRPAVAAGAAGAIALLLALSLVPKLGRFVYVSWMGLGVALGTVTTPVLLGLVWLCLFAPMALFFRLIGRDALRRRAAATRASYWVPHEEPSNVKNYFRQF
jgi:hypothetical protein